MPLLAVEGIDGSGKTTFCKQLLDKVNSVEGLKALYTADPAYTGISATVRDIILNQDIGNLQTLMLISAARSDHYHNFILPNIDNLIITDRFVLSSFAYHVDACGKSAVKDLHEIACDSHYPYWNVIIDTPVEVAKERIESRGGVSNRFDQGFDWEIEYRRRNFLKAKEFLPITYPDPYILDGTRPTEDLVDFIFDEIHGILESHFKMVSKSSDA